jgi:hypothetical protein
MRHIFRNYSWILAAAIMLAVILTFFPGCKETSASASGPSSGHTIAADTVIAKVGDTDVKLGDLVFTAQTMWYFKDSMINRIIMFDEAKRRGIFPSDEDIDKKYKETLEQQGGEAMFFSQLPEWLPKRLVMDDMKNNAAMQIIQEALIKDEFDKVHGPITDDELNNLWTEREASMRPSIASQKGIPPEEVTMDMARDQLTEQVRNNWYNENAQKFFDDLKNNTPVENYLQMQYSTIYPEDIVISEGGDESQIPQYMPVPPEQTEGEQPSAGQTN